MDKHLVGQACALLTAVSWALALVLFKRCGEQIAPMPLNLFKNTVGLVLLALTLACTGGGFDALNAYPIEDIYILLISGVIGIAIADTIFFHALNLLGVGIISIVDCAYSPLVILFSALMLSERLWPHHYVGAALILSGAVVTSRMALPAGRTRGQLLLGMFLGVTSLALMAYGIVLAKPVLEAEDFPLIWATTLRLGAGTAVLALLAAASPGRGTLFAVYRPSTVWKDSVPASVLGAYLALVFWVAGFKYTQASIAGLLNQTSVVFALIFAALILKEPFTRRKAVAVLLALSGVLLVTLNDLVALFSH